MSLPEASQLGIVGRLGTAQLFAAPLYPTQIDLPSRSISTALVAPHVLPSGIFAQFSTVRYGLGSSLTGLTSSCVCTSTTGSTTSMTMATTSVNFTRPERDIQLLL